MSYNQSNDSLKTKRTRSENKRLQGLLSDRNQQLHIVEQQLTNTQLTNTQLSYKHACKNTRMLMALCILLIVVLACGGVQ